MAGEQEVGVRLVLVASHAAPELVQLAQPKTVRTVDDDGVGVGDIEAAFDDGGAEQDIGFAIDELGHYLFKIIGIHLAVADEDPGVRE